MNSASFLRRMDVKKYLFFLLALSTIFSCVEQQSNGIENQKEAGIISHKEANTTRENAIPPKAYEVLAYIQEYHRPPKGCVGGKRFGNYEQLLPQRTAGGEKINYQEWDVNPRRHGANRGAERIVTSNDGRAWFTPDHYKSFIEMR